MNFMPSNFTFLLIWCHVFSWQEFSFLMKKIAFVCKKWHDLSYNKQSFCSHLRLRDFMIPADQPNLQLARIRRRFVCLRDRFCFLV
jgi:hypothetical protein